MAEHEDLSVEALEAEITSWAGHIAAAEYRWLVLIAEYDRRRAWEAWECPSCAHWLMWRCGLNLRAARDRVRVARALEQLPLIAAAFSRGQLSYSKVRALTRIAGPDTEATLLDLAGHMHTAALERVVAAQRRAERLAPGLVAELEDRRHCSWWVDADGSLVLTARLSADEGALLVQALDAATEPAPECSAEQRRLGALVEVAARSLRATDRSGGAADRYQVVVHVESDGTGHLQNGAGLADETVERLLCDAKVVPLVETSDGAPVAVGQPTRTIPKRLRRALRARDGACQFPGCTHHRWLDAHHLRRRADGGQHDLSNLVTLCRRHHRAVHESGWTIEIDPDNAELRFRSPAGWYAEPPVLSGDAGAVRDGSVAATEIVPRWYGDPVHLADIVSHLLGAA